MGKCHLCVAEFLGSSGLFGCRWRTIMAAPPLGDLPPRRIRRRHDGSRRRGPRRRSARWRRWSRSTLLSLSSLLSPLSLLIVTWAHPVWLLCCLYHTATWVLPVWPLTAPPRHTLVCKLWMVTWDCPVWPRHSVIDDSICQVARCICWNLCKSAAWVSPA